MQFDGLICMLDTIPEFQPHNRRPNRLAIAILGQGARAESRVQFWRLFIIVDDWVEGETFECEENGIFKIVVKSVNIFQVRVC